MSNNNKTNTNGGAIVGGNASSGEDFIGRDQIRKYKIENNYTWSNNGIVLVAIVIVFFVGQLASSSTPIQTLPKEARQNAPVIENNTGDITVVTGDNNV